MIFVTVGHQMAFDRLIKLVDDWVPRAPREEVFAQIGDGNYQPKNLAFTRFLTRTEFQKKIDASSCVIAHAGVGTIIQVLLSRKPLLVLPRLLRHEETRSDHQVGTARQFSSQGLLLAGFDETEFVSLIDRLPSFRPASGLGQAASPQLLARIREFIGKTASGTA
jgi:UDP-N-acetylglucosamine transferase subunit ALG13